MENAYYCPKCDRVIFLNQNEKETCPYCSGKLMKTVLSKKEWLKMPGDEQRDEMNHLRDKSGIKSESFIQDSPVSPAPQVQNMHESPIIQKENPMHTTNVLLGVIIFLLIVVIIIQIGSLTGLSLFVQLF